MRWLQGICVFKEQLVFTVDKQAKKKQIKNPFSDRVGVIEQDKTDNMYSINVLYILSNNKKLIEP